ncbi:MAG: hypothetical protein NKF70_13560 [Methanobacterium sp. ERen5]|nr:MAG: hypothetical protein NKF70_13560 [Methanobacterium sp. ERen5]
MIIALILLMVFVAYVTNSIFENNTSQEGGAVHNQGELHLDTSTFRNNSAQVGGAILNVGKRDIKNCIFDTLLTAMARLESIIAIQHLQEFTHFQ